MMKSSARKRVGQRVVKLLLTGALLCGLGCFTAVQAAEPPQTLPGTQPLTLEGDIAAQLVDGVDKFLLRKLDESVTEREKFWKRDFSSAEAYEKSIEPNRQRLAKILGVVDPRVPFDGPEYLATTETPALVGKGEDYEIYAVRWPTVRDVHAEGLLLVPTKGEKIADIVAIPDAAQTPEQICGLADGVPAESQFARRLAEVGCRVLVPTIINRELKPRRPPERTSGGAIVSNREFLYRPAFEMGRHLIGYEVQSVLAGVDWFVKDAGESDPKIGVIGYGEGGMLALYAKALDKRIDAGCVSGYFGSRQEIWQEPIDRNVFGLLEQFGDAELAVMAGAGKLVIETSVGPTLELSSEGGAPAKLIPKDGADTVQETTRAASILGKHKVEFENYGFSVSGVVKTDGIPPLFARDESLSSLLKGLGHAVKLFPKQSEQERVRDIDTAARHARLMYEIERDTQALLAESPYVRKAFMSKLDTSSLEKYQETVEPYREYFATQVIGRFDDKLLDFNPRTRKSYETDKWTGYEVVLDVFPDVIAYGILILPKDLKPGEKRPVVVCQHGLEGRPQDVIGDQKAEYYSAFAGKLAERGFITFAPQNLYIGKDRFRTLQRKLNPLGKTLFSVIVPQHQQICNWLSTLPNVDGERIGFYGLSYGGKSAMRIPPLVPNYSLSICSADFNEWIGKNASTRLPYSYVWTGEYEIYEFDLGNTFNYSDMAALICPRPFMVERGHYDGVGYDEAIGYEFAKVRFLYQARLKLKNLCEIEWFDGPHKINGVATYDFLHRHLNWPEPGETADSRTTEGAASSK